MADRKGGIGPLAVLVACLCVVASGCGEAEGVAAGATVTAYVEAPLCVEAQRELKRHEGRAGDFKLQAVCLPDPREAQKLSLGTVGANARQATEDSTAVAYLENADPHVSRFTHPILEKAEIPWISAQSGTAAMARLLKLIESTGSGSVRQQLREELNES